MNFVTLPAQPNFFTMRKTLFSTLIIVLVGFGTAYSQAGLRLGLKGGLNFANLDVDGASSRTGYHLGAFATIKITKLAIQPEIIFSSQGAEQDFLGEDLQSKINYVNIPILLKLYLAAGLNLQIGPQFGFLVSGDQDVVDQVGNKVTQDAKDFYKGSDVSLGLGAGWDLPIAGLVLDARYNLGLSDINDTQVDETVRNQVFQLSLGIRILELGK